MPLLKAQIIRNDEADPQGRLIADVATVVDLLPGTPEEQSAKLAVLDRIRDRLTPAVVDSLPEDERARVEELRPPDGLARPRAEGPAAALCAAASRRTTAASARSST